MNDWIVVVAAGLIPLLIGGIVMVVLIGRHWRWMAKNAPGYAPPSSLGIKGKGYKED